MGRQRAAQHRRNADVGGKEVSRYIDADKVIEQLKEYIDEYSWVDENGMHGLKWCAMMEALDVVEEAAKQENKKCDWCTSCPSCDNYYGCLRDERNRRLCDYYEPRFNYCPGCGAKMEVL